jgi:hypothetical protein
MKQTRRTAAMVVAAILIVGILGALTLRVPYHKWRWQSCTAAAERLRNGQSTGAEEVSGLIRGEPLTAQDYQAAAMRHENALIAAGYLGRREFRLDNAVSSGEAMDRFTKLALKRFPDAREWSCVFSASGDLVTVTTRPKRLEEWEAFIRAFDGNREPDKAVKCKGRTRRHFEPVRMTKF